MESSKRLGSMHAALCFFLYLTAQCSASYENDFDKYFKFACPRGKGINRMKSYHRNNVEDRRFDFSCVRLPRASRGVRCSWTNDYVNRFDEPVVYMCPPGMYLAGVQSYHANFYEDRRFKYQCCRKQGVIIKSCSGTGWLNNFDQKFSHRVATKHVVTGMASYHKNYYEDRRFQLFECSYA